MSEKLHFGEPDDFGIAKVKIAESTFDVDLFEIVAKYRAQDADGSMDELERWTKSMDLLMPFTGTKPSMGVTIWFFDKAFKKTKALKKNWDIGTEQTPSSATASQEQETS